MLKYACKLSFPPLFFPIVTVYAFLISLLRPSLFMLSKVHNSFREYRNLGEPASLPEKTGVCV
jgi:hypothetical protein